MLEGQRERQRDYAGSQQIDIVHDAGPNKMFWVLDKLLAEEAAEGQKVREVA
jgi:vanillate O-demethylase monooxygenase subunit